MGALAQYDSHGLGNGTGEYFECERADRQFGRDRGNQACPVRFEGRLTDSKTGSLRS
jgi:hypothetical protein